MLYEFHLNKLLEKKSEEQQDPQDKQLRQKGKVQNVCVHYCASVSMKCPLLTLCP